MPKWIRFANPNHGLRGLSPQRAQAVKCLVRWRISKWCKLKQLNRGIFIVSMEGHTQYGIIMSFQMTLGDLAKYSMTRSIARPFCESRAILACFQFILHVQTILMASSHLVTSHKVNTSDLYSKQETRQ